LGLLEELGVERYYLAAGMLEKKVEAALAVYAARRGGLPLYAGGVYTLVLRENGVGARGCEPGRGVYLGCLPPGGEPVFAAGVDGRRLRGLRRLEGRRLAPGVYALARVVSGVVVERSYFTVGPGLEVRPLEPPCPTLLNRVFELLGAREAREKEVVEVLAAELGVGRGEARRLLLEWEGRLCVSRLPGGVVRLL